jgi:hypothetical protein
MKDKITIGIHLRGTDKYLEEHPISWTFFFQKANEQADLFGPQCQFLVATDENTLLEQATIKLNRPVIYYNCRRSSDGKPLHYGRKTTNKAILGEDILIEAQLLSRCNLLIHTRSNVSTAALYFNPDLQNILLTAKHIKMPQHFRK